MKSIILMSAIVSLSGCMLVPDAARLEVEHVSHPLAGPPFGPANEEDGLSQFNVIGRWQGEQWYIEQGFGLNLEGRNGGGFKGPPFTYTGRVGIEFKLHD